MERNAVIDMATATLGDFAKDNPEHKKEAKADAKFLRSQKLADGEAEMTKIGSTFTAILKDIKKDLEDGKATEQPATAEFLQAMREQMQAARLEQKPVEVEDVIKAMMGMVGQAVELDEKSAELFGQLARELMSKREE
jgi:ABC-type glycerol-3-phosphate transport system substrate-binding protein